MVTYLSSLIFSSIFWYINKYHRFTPKRNSPQTFHKKPTSRMGGPALFLSLLFWYLLDYKNIDITFLLILISSLPIFVAGFIDDLFFNIKPFQRILLMIPTPILLFFLVGLEVRSVDIGFIDILLKFDIFALAFMIFAFVGIANSFNIIDGFNALLLGYCLSIFTTLYFSGNTSGDLIFFLFPIFFSLLGIFTLNLFGKIFLGDAGAYFLGTIIASGLIVHQQTNNLSPWFVFLMLIYPVTEVLFSFIRKTFIRGKSALKPDGLHFHMLIYKRVSKKIGFRKIRVRHLFVSTFIFSINFPFMLSANIFSDNTYALVLISLWYVLLYTLMYFLLLPKYIFISDTKT